MSDFEGAIKAAVELEEDGRDFYLGAARKAKSARAGKMFESLAADETDHIAWIMERTAGVEASAAANRSLYGKLKDIFAAASPGEAADSADDDIKAIELAIGTEEKSVEAYVEWAESGPSDAIRKLGSMLADIEKFHRQVLENAKEYLTSPGDWFMQEERWNFDGG